MATETTPSFDAKRMLGARELFATNLTPPFVAAAPLEMVFSTAALAVISGRADMWQTHVAATGFSVAEERLVSSLISEVAEAAATKRLTGVEGLLGFVQKASLDIDAETLLSGGRLLHSVIPAQLLVIAARDSERYEFCLQKCGADWSCFAECYGGNP
jgi:hypothetical protein